MKIVGIIPSRYGSTRFPGKPLIDIGGKTMIRRVYEQSKLATSLSEVVVATDDQRILKEVLGFGGKALMTYPNHKNGTERCAELVSLGAVDADVIINIQGDEPFLDPQQIDALAACFKDPATQIATLIRKTEWSDDIRNPSRVKVVVNKNNQALYFSRSVIPNPVSKGSFSDIEFNLHIGIYAFRRDILMEVIKLAPSPLEVTESLEQLRWLENGYTIKCAVTTHVSIPVDTPDDLAEIRTMLE
jgi:3-deoxy-manno-octulosonate cytidylyltransferase (CMP-KDO synthetase)